MGEKNGKVSKGLPKILIDKIPMKLWKPGCSKMTNCSICFEDFKDGEKMKII